MKIHGLLDRIQALRFKALPGLLRVREFNTGRNLRGKGALALFAHYDPAGDVDPYVLHYLRELSQVADDIVFITTSPSFSEGNLAKLAQAGATVVLRKRNLTLDFGSWKVGLDRVDPDRYDRIFLANDSVYGPLNPLPPIVKSMAAQPYDLWGITESAERAPHVQSYFVAFEATAIRSPFFRDFWDSFLHLRGKDRIISLYEVGLSQRARAHGLRVGTLISNQQVANAARARTDFQYRELLASGIMNPTLFAWDVLIEDFQTPFLKTELFKIDRFDSKALNRWPEVLKKTSYDPELIRGHLQRLKGSPGAKRLTEK